MVEHFPIELFWHTLIETAKLNGVDPQVWLTDVLGRISEHKITKLDELMPWRYAEASAQQGLPSRDRAAAPDGYRQPYQGRGSPEPIRLITPLNLVFCLFDQLVQFMGRLFWGLMEFKIVV